MTVPEPDPSPADAPRVFRLVVISAELVDRTNGFQVRCGFGPLGGVGPAWFHRDFPLLGAPRIGSRWSVTLAPESSARG